MFTYPNGNRCQVLTYFWRRLFGAKKHCQRTNRQTLPHLPPQRAGQASSPHTHFSSSQTHLGHGLVPTRIPQESPFDRKPQNTGKVAKAMLADPSYRPIASAPLALASRILGDGAHRFSL